jgi:hypothetical protein
MSDNYVVSADNNTVTYDIKSTLFNLDNIVFTNILENIKRTNPESPFSDRTIESIQVILKTLKSDSLVHHSKDFDVSLSLYYSRETFLIFIDAENILFPFDGNSTNFHLKITINELNEITSYCFPEKSAVFSKIDNGFFRTIKKIDSFLDYNNELNTLIMSTGISPSRTKLRIDLFELEYDENSLNFFSTLKGFFESKFEMPFLNVHVHDSQCSITVAGQMISLTEQEFLDTDNAELIDIIMRLLKFKKMPIEAMSHLKDYILIKTMETI